MVSGLAVGIGIATVVLGLAPSGAVAGDRPDRHRGGLDSDSWADRAHLLEGTGLEDELGASDHCRYTVRRVLRKDGCNSCPALGDVLCPFSPCNENVRCTAHRKFYVPCLAGPGACRVKGRRESCDACAPARSEFRFTIDEDHLVGTKGDDVFYAWFEFDPQRGEILPTLQPGDSARGLGGNDVLATTFNSAKRVTVPGRITGVETYAVTAFASATLDARRCSGVHKITSSQSVVTMTVSRLRQITDMGFEGINSDTVDLEFAYDRAGTTASSSDEFNVEVNAVVAGQAIIRTAAANGLETVNLISHGDASNTLTALTQVVGASLSTANFFGSQGLWVKKMPDTIRTYDASQATADITLGSGYNYVTYAPFSTADLTALKGSERDDVIILGTTLDENDFVEHSPDLGKGVDAVQATVASRYRPARPFLNVEEFRLNATADGASMNFRGFTGLERLTIESDGEAHTLLQRKLTPTRGQFPTLVFRGDNTQRGQTYDTVTWAAKGNTGANDTLNIDVHNRGTALNASGIANVHAIGAAPLTAAGFESVSITVMDGPAVFHGLILSTLTTLNVTGTSNVTLGRIESAAATIVQVNASGVARDFAATLDGLGSGASVACGGGNDTIIVGASSIATSTAINLGAGNDTFTGDPDTDSADIILAGDGADVNNARGGSDTITTGTGADVVIYDQFTANDQSDITDFTAGAGGDVMRFDISDLQLAGGDEYVGDINGLAPDSSEEIVILTGAGYATDELAENAVAARVTTNGLDMVIIYFSTTTRTTHITQDPDAGFDGSGTIKLLGNLTNITTQQAHDALTAANVDSQP
ncbi:MAG: hypothetical protein C4547_07265 [Phycisphaerales bacterium]|nr:MAG: hypothetical protein C4547_07265 [Phycisphaerales bacterium]